MPKFSPSSLEKLKTCDVSLQKLFNEVIAGFDCSVLCGHRTEKEQNEALRSNNSTKKWPESNHNSLPSKAVDVCPYPIDWNNLNRFYFFGGYVKKTAELMGIKIRWGGDWDSDTLTTDQKFIDLPHFELL